MEHAARSTCPDVESPRPLTTPDPLLDVLGMNETITISFIVGSDGLVHSPLILESANPVQDGIVLRTVRRWRYRPARCHGVPTEVEAKVEFSGR